MSFWEFRDGQMSTVSIGKSEFVSAFIKPIQNKFIDKKSECREESFMECYENYLAVALDECPKKCFPATTLSLPLCEKSYEMWCAYVL